MKHNVPWSSDFLFRCQTSICEQCRRKSACVCVVFLHAAWAGRVSKCLLVRPSTRRQMFPMLFLRDLIVIEAAVYNPFI